MLRFNSTEAAVLLVLIMFLRMFGLFVAIPVLALHAGALVEYHSLYSDIIHGKHYLGFWLGVVMGGYGLMQFLVQIPSGMASDKWGRRPIIMAGLTLFIMGSILCELAPSIEWLGVGRLLQGLGAVSSATTALLSDLTTEENRLKWMAFMGVGISLAFVGGFVFGPSLYGWLSFRGFFLVPAYLAVISMILLAFFPDPVTSPPVVSHAPLPASLLNHSWRTTLQSVLTHQALMPLNAGVFFLHAAMVGVFVVIPAILVDFMQLSPPQQWRFYVWVVPASLFCALLYIYPLQKGLRRVNSLDGQARQTAVFSLPAAIPLMTFLLMLTLWGLSINYGHPLILIVGMLIFFFAFNVLEALQPSMVSFIAPAKSKGTAMGAYHACQSMGLFFGGLSSAWLYRLFDASVVFRWNAALMALWLAIALYGYFQLADD